MDFGFVGVMTRLSVTPLGNPTVRDPTHHNSQLTLTVFSIQPLSVFRGFSTALTRNGCCPSKRIRKLCRFQGAHRTNTRKSTLVVRDQK